MKTRKLALTWVCAVLSGACSSAFAGGANSWSSASDLLAVGLPALAAGVTWAQGDTEGAKELTYSLGGAFAITTVLKKSIHSSRPDGSDNESFPSGHTAVAFAAVRYMDKRYGAELAPYTPWLYAAAGLTGVARVQANKHHWQDVLAGGALGYATAHYLTEPVKGGQLSLLPTPGGMAVAWQRNF
jgi:membrane-associated phospholipid phosphatase